jgi:riboflavin synthase
VFTGIVEELGSVADIVELDGGSAARLRVRGPVVTSDAAEGDSIAVSGVCLTVVETEGDEFTADVMRETLVRTALGQLQPGSWVNLERAVTLQTRLGGHLVQGHVDGTGVLIERETAPHFEVVHFSMPPTLSRYLVEKGSIAVDGVSLTVVHVDESTFTVSLIPTTLERTTLGKKQVGEHVNLEVDVMAKYAERLLSGFGGAV